MLKKFFATSAYSKDIQSWKPQELLWFVINYIHYTTYLWFMSGKSCKNKFIPQKGVQSEYFRISTIGFKYAKFTSNFHVLSSEFEFLKFQ
jgi:hypothetical protein